MKLRYLLYNILFICCSCTRTVQHSEHFDVVTSYEYENIYDSKGRLDSIKITTTQKMFKLNILTSIDVDISLHKYTYHNDSLYSISETSGLNKEVLTTTYFKSKSKEYISIRNNKDTIDYSLYHYRDYRQEMIEYERVIRRVTGEPIINFTINDDYEEWSFYDNECVAKTIRHDFNSSQTEETYYFSDITYKEALQKIPKSNNQQTIICYTSSNINDTLVEKHFINGEISQVAKKYKDHGKEIEQVYDADGHETIYIQYKEKDMDISVVNSTFMGHSTDSTYTRNGKTMRETKISDDSKRLVTYHYDSHGNITKRVEKIKFYE